MRFEGNSRGISRTDYEQFSQFLGLSQPQYQRGTRMGGAVGNTVQGCQNQTQGRPIAMVYGVEQNFCNIYDPEVALENGTIFEELNKPFYPVGCKGKEGCL